ncbi:MAG: glutaredoxin domain-containing protein [Planctomycetota bacterium]|jgi:arsenate reductase|nr:glutaredoxin domain-containing protein [Planctomycetota bacterium]
MTVTMYEYAGCSTCRKARAWLKERGVAAKLVPIREQAPSAAELKRALKRYGQLRRLFNVSGGDYRSGGYKDLLPTMSESDAFAALTSNGNLCKRPVLVVGSDVLVGFDADEWGTVCPA